MELCRKAGDIEYNGAVHGQEVREDPPPAGAVGAIHGPREVAGQSTTPAFVAHLFKTAQGMGVQNEGIQQ